MNTTPDRVGRPTKLTEDVIKIFEEVVNEAIYITDIELYEELKDRLIDAGIDPMIYRSFQNYLDKAENSEIHESEKEVFTKFLRLIKKARRDHKKKLLEKLSENTSPDQWQRFAWIAERKFDDLNLKMKQDITEHRTIIRVQPRKR